VKEIPNEVISGYLDVMMHVPNDSW